MNINIKEVLKDKFWIVEQAGENIGTLSLSDDKYMFNDGSNTKFFDSTTQLKSSFSSKVTWTDLTITERNDINKEVHGYPTSCAPHNSIYDVKRKLPLFTKSEKSKSLYCAGFYVIKFDKGWVKSFCPKLITIERYKYNGPFKTEIEMRTELSRVNSK